MNTTHTIILTTTPAKLQESAFKVLLLTLIMMVMGVGSVWAADWEPVNANENKWTENGITGSGTEGYPYIIDTPQKLAYLGWICANKKAGYNKYWKLGDNIDLSGNNWKYGSGQGNAFQGCLDGNGKTISNVKIVPTSTKANGLFCTITGTSKTDRAEVKNLTIDGVSIETTADLSTNTYIGALAGNVSQYTDIEGVSVNNVTISVKNLTQANYIGAFAGIIQKNSTIKNCSISSPSITVSGEMKTGASYIGGAIGQFAGTAAEGVSTITKLDDTHPGLTVSSPSVTINKVNIKDCYIGAVFGRVNTYSTISNVTVSTKTGAATLNYKNTDAPNVALNLGAFAGGIFGVAAQETAVTKVTITGDAQMVIGSTNDVKGIKAGLIGQSTTNVRLEDWTIENSSIQVSGNLATTNSQLGGFAGYLASAANAPLNLKGINVAGTSTVSVSGNIAIGSQLGGFVANVASTANGDVKFSNTKITGNSSVAVTGTVSATSHIGGFAGQIATGNQANHLLTIDGAGISGTSTLSVGGSVTTATSYFGGFVGLIQGRSQTNNRLTIKNVTNGTSNITVTGSIKDKNVFIGGLAGYVAQGVNLEQLKISTAANLTFNGEIAVASYFGGAFGQIKDAAYYPVSVKGVDLNNVKLTFGSENKIQLNIGGVAGDLTGAWGSPVTMQDVTTNGTKINLNCNQTSAGLLYVGGCVGNQTFAEVKDVTIKNEEIVLNANHMNVMGIGGAFGRLLTYSTVEDVSITGTTIRNEGSHTITKGNKAMSIGGMIGLMETDPVTVARCSSNVDINLSGYTPAETGNLQNNAFIIGGVIGRFNNALTTLPMNLSYSGKIYAPYAAVGPIVGAFVVKLDDAKFLYDDYSGENLTNAVSQWANADTWTYKEYKLGLSPDVLTQTARTKNYSDGDIEVIGGVSYLVIKDPSTTFTTGNSIAGVEKQSHTVLAYTQNNKNQDLGIYPQWTTNAATYPAYYMYYMQGVNRGIYADDVLWPILEPVVGELNTFGVSFSDLEINPEDYYYVWFIDGKEIDGAHGYRLVYNPGDVAKSMYVKIFEDENAYREGRMLAITNTLALKNDWFALITSTSSGNYTVNFFDDSRNKYAFDSHYTFDYQWFVSNEPDGSDAVEQSGTDATISIPLANTADKKYVLCQCTIKYDGQVSYSKLLLYNVNMNRPIRVVYLQLTNKPVNNVTASNGIVYTKENAGVNGAGHNTFETAIYGLIPEKPVSTWAGAYELLKAYTEPTQADVTAHGGTWTKADVYDDEAYYLANKDSYPFDVYKRDGNKRKVKPIEQCTNNWDNNIIVVMGLSNDGYFNDNNNVDGGKANKPVTLTGMYNGVNYYGFHSNLQGDLSLNADHRFENMGFGVSDKGIGATESVRYRIYAHRWNVHAGRGLLMGWAAALKWGPDVVPVNDDNKKMYKITNADPSTGTPVGNYTADIAIMGGYLNDNTSTNSEMFEYINHGRDDTGQQIKIESGFWGPVCPGNRQTDSAKDITTYYTMGGPDHPAKTTITVDICREDNDGNENFNSAMPASTIDVACLLSGNHEGTMYADVTLNILSGHMGRIVNGIKGAQRRQMTKPESFTTAGHYRHIINYGTEETPNWIEIAAPAPDSFFGRGILNFDPASSQNNTNADINGRVSVIELYCGSLGRGHNDGSYHPEVGSYFYGLSEVNIMGGTFRKTIYGAGAGGVNGIGTAEHHTDDDGIPYWNTDLDPGKTHVWYAPYDYIKSNGHNYDFVKIKMTGNGSDDTNLENGYVNMEKTRNIINITGGIFGSESSPASIYGGGFGEANAALINPSNSTNNADNIKNTYNTPNHQGGNMYGATDGLVTQINISGDSKIYGNIYGGGMGSMRYYRYFVRAGEAIVNYPNENQTYTHIMNPGGDTYNKPGGIDWQKVLNTRRNADNYLNVGQVFGNTMLTISGNVEVFGNVYGAGEGVPDMTMDEFFSSTDTELGLNNQLSNKATILNYSGTASNGKRTAHITAEDTWVAFPNLGKLYGDSKVIIDGNAHIHGNVYGGGKAGAMDGNSMVVVKSGTIDGDVFGAGQGEDGRPDKAKVTGKANVIVDSNWTEPTIEP